MSNQLKSLKKYTQVVVDSGEIELIKNHQPLDATTNPSLILKALQKKRYQPILQKAIQQAKSDFQEDSQRIKFILQKTAVLFGKEILQYIKGKISTEIDARLSFDKKASIMEAKEIIELYEKEGISKDRILIKIAATWEGIQAASELEKMGTHCNITLLFTFCQALAAANAGSYLISPFVGRILDWYTKNNPEQDYQGAKDPGVQSVSKIYHYYKSCGIKTIVMGASFRTIEQICQLAGCDKLTISPGLLQQLADQKQPLEQKLKFTSQKESPLIINEAQFRFALNQDTMATEKLAEGIRSFSSDTAKLEKMIREQL